MLGDRLRYIREIRNYTQEHVAQRAGINVVLYRQYELGKKNPKEAQLQKIADALLVHIDFLRLPKVDSADALLAILYELIIQYDDIRIGDTGDTFSFSLPYKSCSNNMAEHFRNAVEAQTKYSAEDFKIWLLNYRFHRLISLDYSGEIPKTMSRHPELEISDSVAE